MTRVRISAVFVATLIVIATSISAQTTTEATPSVTSTPATISVSIAVPDKQIPLEQKPWILLTVKNLTNHEIFYPEDGIYVKGPHGEPPTTEVQRAIKGRWKSGDRYIRVGGFRPLIPSGYPFTMAYDLSYFYDFNEPGKYMVYISVFDELAHAWVHTPAATFELLSPTEATPSVTSNPATISVSIAVPDTQIPRGQKTWVLLTVKNLTSHAIPYPGDVVHVEGAHGELPTRRVPRSITGRLNPGEQEIRPDPAIAPGYSSTRAYDLSSLYDFKEPGKYTVYVEVFDALVAKAKTKTDTNYFVRSPIATFEVLPPTK